MFWNGVIILELMTGQIPLQENVSGYYKGVEDHIEDQKQAFYSEGMKEEEAEEGSCGGDGLIRGSRVEMDQIHRPKMPWKAIL